MNDPIRLTPMERHVDDLMRFENRDRYVAQSKATQVNLVGTLPARYDHGGRLPVIPYDERRGI